MFAKITLATILSAIYTSGWWAWALWAKGDANIIIVPLIIVGIAALAGVAMYALTVE